MTVLPPLVAEKVLLTGYVVLLPLAARYALEGVRAGAGWLAVLTFPLVHSFPYHMGFYNFCYSLGVFFLVVGYWLRHCDRFGPRQALALAALVLLLYFCHLVAVAMALMTVGLLGTGWLLLDARAEKRSADEPSLRRLAVSRLLWPALAFLPALALGLTFVGRQGSTMRWEVTPPQLLDRLIGLDVLVSYLRSLEGVLSRGCFAGLALLCAGVLWRRWRSRQLGRDDLILVAAAVALVAYFTAPSQMSGGSFVNTRLSLFVLFLLILWLAVHPFAVRPKWVVQVSAGLLALGLLAIHIAAYDGFNDYLAEYVSVGGELKPDRTLLPLTFARQLRAKGLGDAKVGVFRHAAGYLAAQRGVIDLENYEAHTDYFPVRFLPQIDPFNHLGTGGGGVDEGLQAEPPQIDLRRYVDETGRSVDYVLLWQVLPEQRDTLAGRAIFDQLAAEYELAFTSARGLAQLYRHKGPPDGPD
jgi:hypothetical protein